MKILHIFLILLIALVVPLLPQTSLAEKSLEIICDEWPPYQYRLGNEVVGFSASVIREVFRRMGKKVNKINMFPWKRAITLIEKGNADALFSVNYTEARTSFAFYPKESIINSSWVMWVREEDGLKFDSLEDLKGKRVGVVRGYSYTDEFWKYIRQHSSYEEVTYDESNFKKLNAARIDYLVAELGNGYHIIKTLNLKKIVPRADNPIKTDGLYLIFKKDRVSYDFVRRFSDELKEFKQEELYHSLYRQHLTP